MEEMMRFNEKDFEIPQVCLDLGFDDRSYRGERSARMYNPQLNLTLLVREPSSGKKRYALVDDGRYGAPVGEVDTDDELCELVASARSGSYVVRGEGYRPATPR